MYPAFIVLSFNHSIGRTHSWRFSFFSFFLFFFAVFSPPIDIKQALHSPAHPVSVRVDSSFKRQRKLCIVTSFETDILSICIANTRYQVYILYIQYNTRYTHACGVCGLFSWAWRRGSWHFQVASLHLQSSMDLLFVRFTVFLLPEQA